MPRENKTKFAILGMLTYGPMSGYDMKKTSDHSIGHFWNENYGNIYPVLKKLEAAELVVMEKQEQDGAPDRKVYTITDKGRDEFAAWMHRSPDTTKLREELLLQIFFGQWFPPELIIGKLREEEARCTAALEELKEIREHIGNSDDTDKDVPPEMGEVMDKGAPYWKSTAIFGMNYYQAVRKSCRQIIAELETAAEKDETTEL